jgi:tape measure domain-containing protein
VEGGDQGLVPTIDDKVVAMSFESSKFESGVSNAISAIDKLKAALHFPNAGKGLDDINAAGKRVDLGHIGNAVDDIKSRLGALRLAAVAVFANIASQAVSAGVRFAKSFTIQPIQAGFQEYATNLNAIQTILANTQASGATLKDVNASLLDLNKYSDKTIYNFSQMAKNIGTFTAAGVDLKTSTASIKGIANLAALSGSNADQASTAMYQLSQAIAAGSVKLQDWNSVVNAGMGGTVFQRALATTAVSMGKLKDNAVKLTGPMKNVSINGEAFRQSLSTPGKASWLTSDVLTKTLQQFTGDLTNAQLKAQGFNDAQIKAIQQTAKTAMHAATEVKTLSQVFDVAKETAGSGWAQTFQIIFGNFTEAKKTFTALSNTINGFINTNANARNKVLADWKALGGRTVLIDSIKTAFHNLGLAVAPIKDAFRDIFPAVTGKNLMDLTLQFQNFANALKPSKDTVDNLRRTFRGLFAVLDIGKQLIGGIFTVFGQLFGAVHDGSGGFLEFTGTIGDFLVKVDQALKKGDGLHNFFVGLGTALAAPIKLIQKLAGALAGLFSGVDSGGISGQMSGLGKVLDSVGAAWGRFIDNLSSGKGILKSIFDSLAQGLATIGPNLGQALSSINWESVFAAIRTGLFAGLVVMLKGFFGKGSFLEQVSKGFGGGILQSISGSFKALQGSMVAMQNNIKADTLQKIAIAIGILTASIVALSFVDPKRLNSALVGIGVAFGELLGAMAILDKIGKSGGFIKMPFIAGAMILFAGAIDILAIAVIALSRISWGDMIKGLTAVAGLMGGFSLISKTLSANSAGMVKAGIGLMGIAIALKILASAIADFGGMSFTELGKGLGAVAVGVTSLVVGMTKMPAKGMIQAGVGLIALAVGLKILASAIGQLGSENWQTIAQGLVGLGIALAGIVLAMRLMPKNMVVNAAGLLLVAVALQGIARAMTQMGGMSLDQIAHGLIALGGALLILVVGLAAMEEALPGAAALAVAAAGIALLTPALVTLGGMSWGSIVKGLIALAAAITIIGIAGAVLDVAAVGLLAFGAAVLMVGAGLALAGAGIAAVGIGLAAIAASGSAAIAVLIGALMQLAEKIPEVAQKTIQGALAIANQLAAVAPKFVDAMVKILNSLVDAVIKIMPKLMEAFQVILNAAITLIRNNESKIIQAGYNLLLALLHGLRDNLGPLVTAVVDIIVKFINAVSSNLNRILTAGENLLLQFVKGILSRVADVASAVVDIISKFIVTIAGQYGRLITAGLSVLTKFLEGIANALPKVVSAATDVIVNFITGISNAGGRIVTAAVGAMIKFINTIEQQSVRLVNAGMQAIINFLNGIAAGINAHSGEMRAAGFNVGIAIIDGMTGGLISKAQGMYNQVSSIMGHAMSLFHKIPGVKSPSTVTTDIGENIMLGLIKGLDKNTNQAYSSAVAASQTVINGFNDTFETHSPSKVMYRIGQFVGQGFAQGLRGSADDIRGAFTDLNTKLSDAIRDARETIKNESEKLRQAQSDEADKIHEINQKKYKHEADRVAAIQAVHKEYADTIKRSEELIAENQNVLDRSVAARTVLTKNLQDEKRELVGLANEYDGIAKRLDAANKKLEDLRKQRRDFITSTEEQYAAAPDISDPMTKEIADAKGKISDAKQALKEAKDAIEPDTQAIASAQAAVLDAQQQFDDLVAGKVLNAKGTGVDLLATYVKSLKTQTTTVAAYQSTLQQLRKLGLDDTTYQKLLSEGPEDERFAEQLLAGGKTAVSSLNTLDSQLFNVSQTLATNAANNLYNAGIKSAQGLVQSLKDSESDITKEMVRIGNKMIAALKKTLKIKSPSEEFAEIGRYSMEGMAKGFTDSTKVVADAVDSAAKDALTAMKQSVRGISDSVAAEIDPNPVITPILDLSQVRTQAQELSALTNTVPITAAASYGHATSISASTPTTQAEGTDVSKPATSVTFEQNNYSPEALSDVEIYRQTKNQLSQLRLALALN